MLHADISVSTYQGESVHCLLYEAAICNCFPQSCFSQAQTLPSWVCMGASKAG